MWWWSLHLFVIYENHSLHMSVFVVLKEDRLCFLLFIDEHVLVDAIRHSVFVHVLHWQVQAELSLKRQYQCFVFFCKAVPISACMNIARKKMGQSACAHGRQYEREGWANASSMPFKFEKAGVVCCFPVNYSKLLFCVLGARITLIIFNIFAKLFFLFLPSTSKNIWRFFGLY